MNRLIPHTASRGAIVILLALATALTACGRKNPPVPPEGEESRYSYPSFYPSRRSGIPLFGTDSPAPDGATEPQAEEKPPDASDQGPVLAPLDRDYSTVGPYGTSSQ